MEYDEVKLLSRIAEGNEAAFKELFDNYKDKLYRYLLKITKFSPVAEEILTDVFVKIWVGRELLGDIQNFDHFLHKVAYNKALDFLRTVSRRRKLQEMYAERMEIEPERGADELLMDAEVCALLSNAIESLPPQRKLIYTLSREEGLTHKQIATALNLSQNTVKNSIVSSTKSIALYLKDSGAGKAALSVFFLLG